MIPHMNYQQYRTARRLVHNCCNYDCGNCLLLDNGEELLLKHIRKNGDKGTPLKELQQVLPGHNRGQIQVLMRELRADGRIECKGKTSAARWFLTEKERQGSCET